MFAGISKCYHSIKKIINHSFDRLWIIIFIYICYLLLVCNHLPIVIIIIIKRTSFVLNFAGIEICQMHGVVNKLKAQLIDFLQSWFDCCWFETSITLHPVVTVPFCSLVNSEQWYSYSFAFLKIVWHNNLFPSGHVTFLYADSAGCCFNSESYW